MSGLLRRVRDALHPDFLVESELAAGGMARVFLAKDPSLERRVAIKVLRPELATAAGAERFLREARLLARVSHPGVVPVHEVGERAGLFYCVLELIEGETLEERLEDGPLGTEGALRLADQLLAALGAAHEQGVVHRDVKPSNVILAEDGRAVLADFGIARREDASDPGLTAPDARPGTPEWMAPEQLAGGAATAQSDLYAAARLVYLAASGRVWTVGADPDRADWTGFPRPVARGLGRALAPVPEERWEDAAALRTALAGMRGRRRRLAGAALLVLGVGIAAAVLMRWAGGSGEAAAASPYDLALLPCQSVAREDSLAGEKVARVAALYLENLPSFRVVPHFRSFRWWQSAGAESLDPYREASRALGTRHVARCTLEPSGEGRLRLALEVTRSDGRILPPSVVEAPAGDPPMAAGDALGLALVRTLRPELVMSGEGHTALSGHDREAVRAFLLGEQAFQRDARARAAGYYEAALEIDPGFDLARWRLVDLRRYLSVSTGSDRDLELLARSAEQLGPVDRRMLAARLAPPGPARLARFRELLEAHPQDPYALFTYGDELFHRGPLFGIGQDSALVVLETAARRDSFLAPAHDHLAMALIRAGEREEARRAVSWLVRLKGEEAEPDLFHPSLLQHAWLERFDAEQAAERRGALFGRETTGSEVLAEAARFGGPYLNLPRTEIALGTGLAANGSVPAERADGHVAAGLGLIASGRVSEGLVHLDASAGLLPGERGRLHAALWRVVPAALGLEGFTAAEADRGRSELERIASNSGASEPERTAAAWGLALHAEAGGAPGAARAWREQVAGLAGAGGKDRALAALDAVRAGRAGDPSGALALSEPLLTYRAADRVEWPFLRSVVYLSRARWLATLGRAEEASRSLLWHEAVDLADVPHGAAQAGEVDWALGAHADLRRARLWRDAGRPAAACAAVAHVLYRWEEPDASAAAVLAELEGIRREACGG